LILFVVSVDSVQLAQLWANCNIWPVKAFEPSHPVIPENQLRSLTNIHKAGIPPLHSQCPVTLKAGILAFSLTWYLLWQPEVGRGLICLGTLE